MGFRVTVRQHFQAALERETKAASQVITKKAITIAVPASALPLCGFGDQRAGTVRWGSGEGEAGTFSLHCLLLLAKSSILLGTDMSAVRICPRIGL